MEINTVFFYDFLSVVIIAIPILVIVAMEKAHQKKPSPEEVNNLQAKLDKESAALFHSLGIEREFDAYQEILKERRQLKIFIALNLAAVYLSALMIFILSNSEGHNLKIALSSGIFIALFFAVFIGIKPKS